jgi:hypothetical protein
MSIDVSQDDFYKKDVRIDVFSWKLFLHYFLKFWFNYESSLFKFKAKNKGGEHDFLDVPF